MSVLNSLKTVLMVLSLFSQSALLLAQGQWVGDLYLVSGEELPPKVYLVDENNHVDSVIPNVVSASNFPIPREYHPIAPLAYWRNDALYTIAYGVLAEKNEDGKKFRRYTFAKWENNEWHFLGDFKLTDTKEIELLKAIPCDNDRFIVISENVDLINNKRADKSPFHKMSRHPSKNEIRLDASIDYGSVMDDLQLYRSDCFELANYSDVLVTKDYAVLVNYSTGLFWIFSLEKATLKFSGTIFKQLTPEMIAKGGFPNAILCANPEKDGTILLSAQEEAAFMTETGHTEVDWEYINNKPDLQVADIRKVFDDLEKEKKELAKKNPLLVWYRIYPENGKVEKLSPFPNGAASLRDGESDMWRPMPDGSVRMGPLVIADDNTQQKNKEPSAPANQKQSNDLERQDTADSTGVTVGVGLDKGD